MPSTHPCLRRRAAVHQDRKIGALLVVLSVLGSWSDARAACNLIPVAAASYPSVQGGVVSPITAPGEIVEIRLNGCDPTAGFEAMATANEVTITFEPPTGAANTDVVLNTLDPTLIKSVDDCTLSFGRCRILRFETPDTTGLVLPDLTVTTRGLAGPARVTVRDSAAAVVAEIGELNLPAVSCDKQPETVFGKLTILPVPNNFFDLDTGATTEILATVDGNNNLIIPFDYWGDGLKSVLFERPGTPEARFLEGGSAAFAAFTGFPQTVTEAVAGQSQPSRFLRSFTLDGRPLPPLLRVAGNGSALFGTADAVASAIRVAINDGMGGPDIYDVTDRLSAGGRGAIVIGGPTVSVRSPLPLRSLRSSAASVAYARDEARELANLNADPDQADLVVEIVDGSDAATFLTAEAVTEIANNFFIAPALVASDDKVAYLLSERDEGMASFNGDGDDNDNIVRVRRRDGTLLAGSVVEDASLARLVDGAPAAISGEKVFFRSPGAFIDAEVDGVGGVTALGNARDVALSPDNNQVYATAGTDQGVVVFTRDPVTGALSFFEEHTAIAGLNGATDIEITPDGANAYVASDFDHAVVVFERDLVTGSLTYIESIFAANPGPPAIFGARGIAISPDSNFVYVGARDSDAVSVFERTGAQGELTFVETETNGFGGVTGIDNVEGVIVSPDGQHVYAAGATSDAVVTFSRNAITGELTFVEAEVDGVGGVDGIDGVSVLAIDPDGTHVYAPGAFDQALAVFERDAGTGALTFVGAHFDAEDTLTTLTGALGVAVSPDGQRVYTTARTAGAVSIFRRNSETGEVIFEDAIFDSVGGVDALGNPLGVAVGPAGEEIYVAGNTTGSVVTLRTTHRLSAIDLAPVTPVLLATRPPATRVATAGQRAAYLRPEAADGVDLNGDGGAVGTGDITDEIVQVYDATVPATGGVVDLAIAGNRVAISDTLVAFTVPEANEGVPLDGDGNLDDDILYVYEIGELPAPSSVVATGETARAMGVAGNKVVFITQAGVLRVFDYDPGTNSGVVVDVGESAEEFIVDGDLVAFRTSEAKAGANLNPSDEDTDQNDFVMRVFDLSTNTLIDTARSAILCFLPACDPTRPYVVTDLGNNRTAAYLTDELDEGRDLNLDGDADDIVLTLFNTTTRTADTIATVIDNARDPASEDPETPPFPDDPFGGTLIINEVLESDIGVDVNEDGDLDDVVVVLIGDADEDGTVDDFDVCREIAHSAETSSVDADGDRLGDTDCDPIVPPPCGTAPRIGCRAPLAPGKASVLFKNKAGSAKDQFKFKWSRGDATSLAEFGSPNTDLDSNYAICVYDGSSDPQPVMNSVVLPGGRSCGKKPCWSTAGTSGLKFKDKLGVPLGITGLTLKAGEAGKAKIVLKAKGSNLTVPTLPLMTDVTVQLVVDDGSGEQCWGATFGAALKEDSSIWKAKGQ